ncbi:Uma2 family endonuclease [Lusitaniella coriacea LEGE 07157]|uniref:Uma2 family endonuclease n=1 Tax=Lusitaniella coriacea LEGE 07157 TaxID=945747 RepID=A0A8J7DST2_9CYAN|nr:Uma2 family endonuclease [Lusitaniella coriacea]MBE9114712.1 Uma2 family endonuclease [Lusitaniella coriacea LEGE 07157]
MNAELLEKLDTQTEQRLILRGIPWQEYLAIDSVLENVAGLRLTYCQGLLEIMTLSPQHEREKKAIARLLEMYAFAKNLDLHGCGSTTYRNEAEAKGLEPDECYCVGELKEIPDFAVEVTVTSGRIDKLQVYLGLNIAEVWFWQEQKFSLYRLQDGEYRACEVSQFFPELDLTLLASYVQPDNQPAAIREFFNRLG